MTRGECQSIRDLLDDHLSGELMVETMREIVAHLEHCGDCRMELDRRQAVRSALRRRLDHPMPPTLRGAVLRAVTTEAGLASHGSLRRRAETISRVSVRLVARGAAALARARQWTGPIAATLAIVAVVVLRFLLGETPVTAAELLARSTRIERETVIPADVRVRRVLMVEERALPSGAVVDRRRVELWQDGRTGMAVRREFDEGRQLLASEHQERDGVRTTYRRGAPASRAARGATRPSVQELLAAREAWRLNLSTLEFLSAFPGATPVRVTTTASEYEISYQPADAGGDSDLSLAVLTLRRADLRPVREVLATGRGADVREYRVTEEAYESLPAARVPDTIFDTDAAMMLPATRFAMGLAALPSVPASWRPPSLRGFSASAEVDLLYELHRTDACLQEGTEIRRDGDAIEVRAAVASEAERAVLLRALGEAAADTDATVRVDVRSPAMAQRGEDATFTGTPDGDALRGYFTEYVVQRLPSGHRIAPEEIQRAADDAAGRLIERLRQRTAAARQHALALRALVDRFTSARPDGLDVEKTLTWQTMIRDHARAVRRETETIRLELEPISFASLPLPKVIVAAIESGDLLVPVIRLVALTEAHHAAVLRAFGAAASSADPINIGDTAFWRSLLEAETLAQEFDRPWSLAPPR